MEEASQPLIVHSMDRLGQLAALQRLSFVIFIAKWESKKTTEILLPLQSLNPACIFLAESHGCDEIETFVIDELGATSLPCVVLLGQNLYSVCFLGYNWRDISQYSMPVLNNIYLKPFWAGYQPGFNYILHLLSDAANSSRDAAPLRLFISGDRASVGKSTTCLLILSSLIQLGVDPRHLAYIKPCTQSESLQPVTAFCQRVGIATEATSPVVFYQGFTRAYLQGNTESSATMIANCVTAVNQLAKKNRSCRLIVIDGVGYPSVGSICDISNAAVAKALHSPVLLVGKSGVGDAVDSYNLNRVYFEAHGCSVLGGIFNKLEMTGFYSLESCREALNAYFAASQPTHMPYGFVPKADVNAERPLLDKTTGLVDDEVLLAWTNVFMQHVDLQRLVLDTLKQSLVQDTQRWHQERCLQYHSSGSSYSSSTAMDVEVVPPRAATAVPQQLQRQVPSVSAKSESSASTSSKGMKRTRPEIEQQSIADGASCSTGQ